MPLFFVLFCLGKSCESPSFNTQPVNSDSSLDTTSKLLLKQRSATQRYLSSSFQFFFFFSWARNAQANKKLSFLDKESGTLTQKSYDVWNKLVKLKSQQKTFNWKVLFPQATAHSFLLSVAIYKKYEPSKWHTVNKRNAFAAWSLALQRVPQKRVCEYCLCLFMFEYWMSYHRMQDECTCVYPVVFCPTGVEWTRWSSV